MSSPPSAMDDLSFTKSLLKSQPDLFRRATQSAFLRRGAQGKLSKDKLGHWLGNDRLYIHAYIRGLGKLLGFLKLPESLPAEDEPHTRELRLLDWLTDALMNVRREEKFFVEAAKKHGVDMALETINGGVVPADVKVEGMRRFETIFDSIGSGPPISPPWIDAAVIFWATEKCYLEAWRYAKSQVDDNAQDASEDEDGGLLRNELIPNWTSSEFEKFVDELGRIIDDMVAEQIKITGYKVVKDLVEYFRDRWTEVLEAEEKFWPEVSEEDEGGSGGDEKAGGDKKDE